MYVIEDISWYRKEYT